MFDPLDKTRRSPRIRIAQVWVRWFFRMSLMPFQLRVKGLERYPKYGPMLVCSNHQSNLDPLILGAVCPRPINYLAKKQLFQFKPLGWFLRWNDVIEIDRDATSLGGIKKTLKRLKNKESVLMFPEGTRSKDGEMRPLKRGFCTLVRKTKVPIFPVGLAGARDAWPIGASVPNLGATIQVVFGDAIEPEEYADLSDEDLTELLDSKIRACFAKAREINRNR